MFKRFATLIASEIHSENQRRAMQDALIDERHTSELREQFIAVLGHDLRNPLAAIAAGADLLLRKQDDPALVRNMASRIQTNIQRMIELINETADLARGRFNGGLDLRLSEIEDPSHARHLHPHDAPQAR